METNTCSINGHILVAHVNRQDHLGRTVTDEFRGYDRKDVTDSVVIFVWHQYSPKEERITIPLIRIYDITETLEEV